MPLAAWLEGYSRPLPSVTKLLLLTVVTVAACLDIGLPELVEIDLVGKIIAVDLSKFPDCFVESEKLLPSEMAATLTPSFKSGWSPRLRTAA